MADCRVLSRLTRLFSIAMVAVGFITAAVSAAPVSQHYGNVTILGTRWSGEEGSDGLFHMVWRGGATLTADSQPGSPANRHYELHADSIDSIIGGGTGANMLAHATAAGSVRMVARSAVPARGNAPAGERVLIVTGGRATFEGRGQTVDITESPVIQISDPSLPEPAVLSNAISVHVDLIKRTFEASGDPNHRPTATLALPATPDGNATPEAPAGAQAPQAPISYPAVRRQDRV